MVHRSDAIRLDRIVEGHIRMTLDKVRDLGVVDGFGFFGVELIVAFAVLIVGAGSRRVFFQKFRRTSAVVIQEDLPHFGKAPVLIRLAADVVVVGLQFFSEGFRDRRVILLHLFLLGIRPVVGRFVFFLHALPDQFHIVDETLDSLVRIRDEGFFKTRRRIARDVVRSLKTIVLQSDDIRRIDCRRAGVCRVEINVQIEEYVLDRQRLAVREFDVVLNQKFVSRILLSVLFAFRDGVVLCHRRLALAADDVALLVRIQHTDLRMSDDCGVIRRGREERVEHAVRGLNAHGKRSCLRIVLAGRFAGVRLRLFRIVSAGHHRQDDSHRHNEGKQER